MAVQILLDQAGRPPGVAGRAREDFSLGTAVVAQAVGGPFKAVRWSFVSRPVDVAQNVRSGAGFSAPTATTTQVAPIDVRGTYLLEVVVDAGFGFGARLEDAARITFYAGPALAAAAADHPRRPAAFGERREHNVPDAIDPSGNAEGWAREKAREEHGIRDLWLGRAWAGGVVEGGTSPSLLRNHRGAVDKVEWNAATNEYEIVFVSPMPDADYSVLVTPRGAAGAAGFVAWRVASASQSGFAIAFCDDLSTGAKVPADFSFQVSLGLASV